MKVKDIYGLDDNIENFVIHSAEEELSSVKIEKVEIKRKDGKMLFNFYCDRHDGESIEKGIQQDLSQKVQKRIDKFHKNFVNNVKVQVIQV